MSLCLRLNHLGGECVLGGISPRPQLTAEKYGRRIWTDEAESSSEKTVGRTERGSMRWNKQVRNEDGMATEDKYSISRKRVCGDENRAGAKRYSPRLARSPIRASVDWFNDRGDDGIQWDVQVVWHRTSSQGGMFCVS